MRLMLIGVPDESSFDGRDVTIPEGGCGAIVEGINGVLTPDQIARTWFVPVMTHFNACMQAQAIKPCS